MTIPSGPGRPGEARRLGPARPQPQSPAPQRAGPQRPPLQRAGPPRTGPPRTGPQRPGRPRKPVAAVSGAGSADRFAALADPSRRHLLESLAASDQTVTELMTGLDISQGAVSQHLRVLRDAGLVMARQDGRYRRYRLQPAGLTELRDWLEELERFWHERLAALGDYLEQGA